MTRDSADALAVRGAWFGLLAAAASGTGQTFFIGLFGAPFRDAFGLNAATLGGIYGIATLASGLLMFWLGELADRLALKRAITLSLGLVAGGALAVSLATSAMLLGAGLFLLRLGGQGLTGHFAIVAAARFSGHRRGRGVARASMGFILAEASYPLLVTAALGLFDWRAVWLAVAVLTLAVLVPALRAIASEFPMVTVATAVDEGSADEHWTRRRLIVSPPFLGLLGVVLVPAFVVTALFFHQSALAQRLGWTPTAVAQAFMLYAACQVGTTLLAGRLVDELGARALMRVYLVPMAAGLLGMLWLPPVAALWVLFAGCGFTAGANSVVAGAVWVEVFGSRRLGLVRGVYAAIMVIATAVSPILLGALLSAGLALPTIFLPVIAYAVTAPWALARFTRSDTTQRPPGSA